MILPIVGIRLKSAKFVPLITTEGNVKPVFEVYKNDFTNSEIPIYLCSMENSKKIGKVYKIGKITVAEKYFSELKEDQNDNSKEKKVLFVETRFEDETNIAIRILFGNESKQIPLKEYTADIRVEYEEHVAEEREELLLDYGNFVKCKKKSGFLLPEKDLTEDGSVLSEKENEKLAEASEKKKSKNKKENKKDDFDDAVKAGIKTKGSLAAKINGLFVFFVILTVCIILAGTGYFIYRDLLSKVEKTCENKARNSTVLIENKLKSLSNSTLAFNSVYEKSKNKGTDISSFFKSNPDVALVSLAGGIQIVNEDFILKQGINENNLASALQNALYDSEIKKVLSGKKIIKNVSHYVKTRTAALCIPVLDKKTNEYQLLAVIFSTSDFEDVCENDDEYVTLFTDENEYLIAGMSYDMVMKCYNICDLKNEIVKTSRLSEYSSMVSTYAKLEGYNKYFIDTLIKIAYVASTAIIIMIIFVSLFSDSIVKPINKMRLGIEKVITDDFNFKIKSRRQDELGALVRGFSKMCERFNSRDSYRKTFGNLTVDNIYKNEQNLNINLNGETKITTVLISEIHDFDSLTAGMTASEIIKLLNEYVSEMEPCITATGGFINKVIGNKIFAAWGSPISSGTPKNDAINAIKSAFRMKYALVDFNSDRGTKNKFLLKVGFGLHTGATVSGLVGTGEIKEYTCVGTTVNSAIEIEKYTKSFGCEILISEDTYLLVNDIVEVQKISDVSIKGQKEAITLYAVSALKK